MSKVLIDRALLERAVYRLELAYDADAPIVCDLSSVLSAPSGTPAMPVKAYYHEAPNEYGGFNKSVGLEVRKEFTDAPLVLEADALARIACLEGEIAKRDAELCERTEEVEHALADLNNALAELAAIKAQEPVAYISGCYRDVIGGKSDRTPLGAELAFVNMGWIGQIPLYAAPVSEAKAQGVVMPRNIEKSFLEWASAQLKAPTQLAAYMAGADEVARLSAAPVQQVSVPDGWRLVTTDWLKRIHRDLDACQKLIWANLRGCDTSYYEDAQERLREIDAMLAAAPAAPAADAVLVEALGYQVLFDAIAAATSVYANGAINISVQAFRAAIATHRAKGVV